MTEFLKTSLCEIYRSLCLGVVCNASFCYTYFVTEFWKITHMGVHEINRIVMFSGLLIRAGHSFLLI